MLDDVMLRSKEIPGHKYDHHISLDKIKFHKPIYYKMIQSNKPVDNGLKPKKSKEPDVGTYEPFKAFVNT